MRKKYVDDCIFCKINKGEIPSTTIYEDDDFKVMLDINPAADPFELADDDAEKLFKIARKCAKSMMEVLHCDGINVLQNNGEAAGQTVFHLHVHLIPRYKGDTVNISWKPGTPEQDAAELAAKIKANIQ